jgi:hypothetical protein
MDVINESTFSIDEISDITIKCYKLSGKRLWIYIILVLLSIVTCAIGLILAKVDGKKVTDFILIGVCLFIILFILIYFLVLYPKRIRKSYVDAFGDKVWFKYIFHINRVDVITDPNKENEKSVFTYNLLKKVVETDDILRIYIAKNNFLPVKKENFVPNEFIKIKKAMQNSKLKYIEKIKNVK